MAALLTPASQCIDLFNCHGTIVPHGGTIVSSEKSVARFFGELATAIDTPALVLDPEGGSLIDKDFLHLFTYSGELVVSGVDSLLLGVNHLPSRDRAKAIMASTTNSAWSGLGQEMNAALCLSLL